MRYLLLILLFALGCEYTIGEKKESTQSPFTNIETPKSFNFESSSPLLIQPPKLYESNLVQLLQITQSDTMSLGFFPIQNDIEWPIIEQGVESIVLNPFSFKGAGDYQVELTSNEGMYKRFPNSGVTDFSVNNLISLGTWNTSSGLPDYLVSPDQIPQDLLDDINATLPESRPVPQYNPEYLQDIDMNTLIVDDADIWVTFVHEGAGYRSTLGYFRYNQNTPPSSINDVDSLFVIFPNVSFRYSGGELSSGDKVYLGRFNEGDVISWFLMPNAWRNGIRQVDEFKYSTRAFNDFTSEQYRQHTLLLNDTERELLLLAFEDISRPGGDNDFNDAIFYVTANPYEAVETATLTPTKKAKDSDGDGAFDHEEDYPNDPERAYSRCYPTCNSSGTLLFEDNWPSKGDYDFNDVVVDYNFKYILSANGKIKELQINTELRATGGIFKSSLLFNLGIDQNRIESVSGSTLNHGFITTNDNGTETYLDNAVIPIFDNAKDLLTPPPGYSVTNVLSDQPHKSTISQTTTVIFKEAVHGWELTAAPHDPFIVVEFDRGREIHLPGNEPTAKASQAYFGQEDDRTSISSNFTYKTELGHPWALNINRSIKYPLENVDFTAAYINFKAWVESGGVNSIDWYFNIDSNINSSNVYQK